MSLSKWCTWTLALVLLLAVSAVPVVAAEPSGEVEIRLDQKVRMADGTQLSANVFLPADQTEPLPTVFTFTPYLLDQRYQDGVWFAERGYNFVRADVRGRGNSEGEFFPNEDVGADGAEIVRWIARQPWSDGQVAMFGGSYEGLTQWQVLKEHPPELKTIAPMAAAYSGTDGKFFPPLSYMIQWLASVNGRTSQLNLFLDFAYWNPRYYRAYAEHIPWARLAEFMGFGEEIWERWYLDPKVEERQKAAAPTPADYARFDVPILTVTSYYDWAQENALRYFREHMQHGSPSGRMKHQILMGPWSHGGTMRPTQTLSGLDFGPDSVPYQDFKELALQWYDWVMKDGPKPTFLKDRITYYVTEENVWKYADGLDEVSNGTVTFYLDSDQHGARDIFHAGMLQSRPVAGERQPDEFVYDPLDIMSAEEYLARPPNILNPKWLTDGTPAYEENILIYMSPPLERGLEVVGTPTFRAYIELNVPDTDLHVGLYEVRPDGGVIWLGETFQRARYRNGRPEKLVTPGAVEPYDLEFFLVVARRVLEGSRLQLIVNGLNHPNYQKNYNSGGDVNWETAEDARTALIRLYHDERHPSALVLPVWE